MAMASCAPSETADSTASSGAVARTTPAVDDPRLMVSGSITVSSGETITGRRVECTDGRPAITIPGGVHDVVIEGNVIGPCSAGLVGVYAEPGSGNITVRNNTIHKVASGMWANHAQNPVVFEGNRVYDVLGPYPRGQAVQFDNVTGGDGQSRIEGNVSDWMERTGATAYEDHINVYMSSGKAGEPILIKGNKVRGGDSESGAGITVGDGGGGWIEIDDNLVVSVPNTGIAIAGGHDIRATNNRVVNMSTPEIRSDSAMYIRSVNRVQLQENRVVASACQGSMDCSSATHMAFWYGPDCTDVQEEANNWYDLSLRTDLWNQVWQGDRWR